MYACGLRISEATTLEISAIDRANQVLRIIGKGNKISFLCVIFSFYKCILREIFAIFFGLFNVEI